MLDLAANKCTVCQVGTPKVTDEERVELTPLVPAWRTVVIDGVERLERRYAFDDFAAALAFTNRVGAIAEEAGHHPALLTEYGSVTVSWWTHKIGGLHRNDFVMAAKSDRIYEG